MELSVVCVCVRGYGCVCVGHWIRKGGKCDFIYFAHLTVGITAVGERFSSSEHWGM